MDCWYAHQIKDNALEINHLRHHQDFRGKAATSAKIANGCHPVRAECQCGQDVARPPRQIAKTQTRAGERLGGFLMRNAFLLIGIVTATLLATSQDVHAADMPSAYKAPPKSAVAPLFNWTGFYVGADAGYLWGRADTTPPGFDGTEPRPNGISLGGHLGYRHQLSSGLVFGSEVDATWLDADTTSPYPGGGLSFLDLKWNASLRGILGFAVDRALLYATAGGSWIKYEGCFVIPAGCAPGSNFESTELGWAVGAGMAYALTENMVVRIEYQYADYGTDNHRTPLFAGGSVDVSLKTHTARAGVSWKFGSH